MQISLYSKEGDTVGCCRDRTESTTDFIRAYRIAEAKKKDAGSDSGGHVSKPPVEEKQ